jgi:cardiolipin hydrolase
MEALSAERDSLNKRSNQLDLQIVQLNAKIAELNASLASRMRGEPAILAIRFSPRGGSASEVIYWIGRANRSLHVLIYSFTLDSIGDAILGAYRKDIDVKVVFEKSQINKLSEIFRLEDAGIPVRNDTNPAMMHHKVAIIDGSIVLIGSFNWSSSADEDHNEDLLVIRSSELALALEQEFRRIWDTGI